MSKIAKPAIVVANVNGGGSGGGGGSIEDFNFLVEFRPEAEISTSAANQLFTPLASSDYKKVIIRNADIEKIEMTIGSWLEELIIPGVKSIKSIQGYSNSNLMRLYAPNIKEINSNNNTQFSLQWGYAWKPGSSAEFAGVEVIDTGNYSMAGGLNDLRIYIGPNCRSISSSAFGGFAGTLDCGFAEGAVSGAPWGAIDATINYNVPVPKE